ncbi:MAG: phosphoglucomutase/phosphomannomutase family protein [Oscillospiraceae bacterium]|nr:phosphoglucomutase/phosphomannomutase family protein [Oscillospiraceae bacterium]
MIKFGTGGFRAVIADDFTKANLELLAQGLADKMAAEGVKDSPVAIGYDRRFMSDTAAKWCSQVLAANGIPVYFIAGESPTPLIMFTVKKLGCHYGMAITASHNPAEYNGVKIFTLGGRDASKEVTDELEGYIARVAEPRSVCFDSAVNDGTIKIINPTNDYIDSILSVLDIEKIKNSSVKVLLDPMFGVSRTCLQTILLTCRCEVDVINDRHDTLFGGRLPSPSAKTLKQLSLRVVENGYDLGIGTDGDADRIGLIDASGKFIHPNDIMVLLYYYLRKYKGWEGGVVRNLCTTHLLDRIAEDLGDVCYEVPVGFKHISHQMDVSNALIGGESSGGLTVRGHISGKDGIYAAALIVEMLCTIGKPLSAILDEIHETYGNFEMAEFDCRFSQEKKNEIEKTLFSDKLLPDFGMAVEKVSYDDGLKVTFAEGAGWINCRFSGTEPLIRIFCERDDIEKAHALIGIMRNFLGL